jgi:hypothetical protein
MLQCPTRIVDSRLRQGATLSQLGHSVAQVDSVGQLDRSWSTVEKYPQKQSLLLSPLYLLAICLFGLYSVKAGTTWRFTVASSLWCDHIIPITRFARATVFVPCRCMLCTHRISEQHRHKPSLFRIQRCVNVFPSQLRRWLNHGSE